MTTTNEAARANKVEAARLAILRTGVAKPAGFRDGDVKFGRGSHIRYQSEAFAALFAAGALENVVLGTRRDVAIVDGEIKKITVEIKGIRLTAHGLQIAGL